jgi:GNAT superfamily N-acetyltransferase
VSLRSGRQVLIRTMAEADEQQLCRFLAALCLEARRLRFFSGGVDIEHVAHQVAAAGPGRLGLLALGANGEIAGHAVAITLSPDSAEVAVEVADELHGEGLGTILIERLAELAEGAGITTFVAQVLGENRPMLDVFRDGFDAHVSWRDGVDFVEFPTSAWRLAQARYPSSTGTGSELLSA